MGLFDYGLDPKTQGLLAAAFQGLQASGPSRMPASLGQIIGQAGSAGLNEFQQATVLEQKRKQAEALMALEQQRAEMERLKAAKEAKAQAGIDAFQEKIRSGAYTQSPAQQALAGGGGPTPENAGLIGNFKPKIDRSAMLLDAAGTPGLMKEGLSGLMAMEEAALTREGKMQDRLMQLDAAAQNAALSREDRAQRAKEAADLRRELQQNSFDNQRAMVGLAAGMRQPRNLQLTTDAAGNQLIVNPDGTTRPLTTEDGAGVKKTVAADKPMTEFQGKAALYGTRAAQSDKVLKALEDKISTSGLSAAQSLGTVGNFMMSSEQKRVSQAQRDFVNSVLRQESGAVISDAEFENAKKQYFPAPGDDKKTIEQKRANRQMAIQGFSRMSGPKGAADINAVLQNPLLPGVGANPETPQESSGVIGRAPTKISSDAEFDALPRGAMFVGPDGKTRRKP